MASFPENRLERIEEALSRALEKMPADARAKLKELSDPENILGLAVVLGIWGGLQLTPVGAVADTVLAAYGALSLGQDGIEMIGAAIEASDATDDALLDKAAARLSKAIVAVGVDAIAAAVANPLFKGVRKIASAAKGALKGAKIERGASKIPGVAKTALAGAGAVAAAPAVGSAVGTVLKVAIPAAGVMLLLSVLLSRKAARKGRA